MKTSEFIREAKRKGWVLFRQAKGSHTIYEKDGQKVTIPDHGAKELPRGLEKALRKKMGL